MRLRRSGGGTRAPSWRRRRGGAAPDRPCGREAARASRRAPRSGRGWAVRRTVRRCDRRGRPRPAPRGRPGCRGTSSASARPSVRRRTPGERGRGFRSRRRGAIRAPSRRPYRLRGSRCSRPVLGRGAPRPVDRRAAPGSSQEGPAAAASGARARSRFRRGRHHRAAAAASATLAQPSEKATTPVRRPGAA